MAKCIASFRPSRGRLGGARHQRPKAVTLCVPLWESRDIRNPHREVRHSAKKVVRLTIMPGSANFARLTEGYGTITTVICVCQVRFDTVGVKGAGGELSENPKANTSRQNCRAEYRRVTNLDTEESRGHRNRRGCSNGGAAGSWC